MKIPAWAVAAAILLRDKQEVYKYDELADEVLKTKLSDLTGRGGLTPAQTLKTILMKKKVKGQRVFIRVAGERGYYVLGDPDAAKEYFEVEDALRSLLAQDRNRRASLRS